ncbi:MAG TPA: hypothetical protein DDW93_00175 [Firmicutes bacterium]|jgi:undecaprenyl-diphosphatase|nr:hypothetical protein [Bacillota bacterium]HBK68557.1 hypothetical protein [Bacillota bacterium]HBT16017.1 hypothetical protein [Bacillota bacterium]
MSAYILGLKRFEYKLLSVLNLITEKKFMRSIVLSLTQLGDSITPLVLVMFFSMRESTRTIALTLAAAHFCTNIPVQMIKNMVARPRPYQTYSNICNKGPALKDYSFPSGHTTSAFTTATTLAYYMPGASLLLYGLAAIVGLTRMLLGVHYPTDVLIGSLIGTLIPIILLSLIP